MNDTYGSTLREAMKKSMEEPVKWRPTNHIEDCRCALCHQEVPNRKAWFIVYVLWGLMGVAAAALLWATFVGLEQWLKHLLSYYHL